MYANVTITYLAPGSCPEGTSGTPISGSANAAEMGVLGAFSRRGILYFLCKEELIQRAMKFFNFLLPPQKRIHPHLPPEMK